MLKNAYFLAKIGADTAENEGNFAEHLPEIGNYRDEARHRGDRRLRQGHAARTASLALSRKKKCDADKQV